MHSPESIGQRLEMTRRVFGLNQQDFAARAGIAQNTYNQIERGKKRPSVEVAILLCEAYNLTLDWVFRGDPSGLPYGLANEISERRRSAS